MQITPFFLAFAVGIYLLEIRNKSKFPFASTFIQRGTDETSSALISLALASLGYIIGFSILFALRGTSGWGVAAYIVWNVEDLRKASAIYAAFLGLAMGLYPILRKMRPLRGLCFPAGLLLGVSFAVAYSPCIPPVMSSIMNFASNPANAHRGFHLLAVYGFGLTLAFTITGILVALLVGRLVKGNSARNAVIYISAAILLIMSVLLATDLIIIYKSFLVGLVLE